MSDVIPEDVKAQRDKVWAETPTPEPRKSVKEYLAERSSTHYVMQIGRLSGLVEELRAENERLRAALKPILPDKVLDEEEYSLVWNFHLNAAAKAYKGTGDD